jgi:hypothetical protein
MAWNCDGKSTPISIWHFLHNPGQSFYGQSDPRASPWIASFTKPILSWPKTLPPASCQASLPSSDKLALIPLLRGPLDGSRSPVLIEEVKLVHTGETPVPRPDAVCLPAQCSPARGIAKECGCCTECRCGAHRAQAAVMLLRCARLLRVCRP